MVFEVVHGKDSNTSDIGYAAIDSFLFDYTPEMQQCQTMPPAAEVKPTEAPPTETPDHTIQQFCNFEENLGGWTEESGLNATAAFVWSRTSGEEQDGLTGPQEDYDQTGTSKHSFCVIRH